jgi:aspartyl-tRNA(Asn)/glutamyl-tRNA(Gln) amidotransferase subunit B
MFQLIDKGIISGKIAKQVFEEMYETGLSAEEIVQRKGLIQVSDQAEIEQVIIKVLADNPEAVEKYRAGSSKVFGFFVGEVMKQTKGKANPKIVNQILKEKLNQ